MSYSYGYYGGYYHDGTYYIGGEPMGPNWGDTDHGRYGYYGASGYYTAFGDAVDSAAYTYYGDSWQNEDDTGGPASMHGPSSQPSDTSLPHLVLNDAGKLATVTFQANADHPVTEEMSTTVSDIVSSDPNIGGIQVSATTNGNHIANSDHTYGDAVDIASINGVHVGTTGAGYDLARELVADAAQNPNVSFIESPAGNFFRSPGGSWQYDPTVYENNDTHVHISVYPQ